MPLESYTTPDGLFRVESSVFEMRMSHWVENPKVVFVPTGEVLLNLWGTMWDGSATQDEPGRLTIRLREYPGDKPGYVQVFDAVNGTVIRIEGERQTSKPMPALQRRAGQG